MIAVYINALVENIAKIRPSPFTFLGILCVANLTPPLYVFSHNLSNYTYINYNIKDVNDKSGIKDFLIKCNETIKEYNEINDNRYANLYY